MSRPFCHDMVALGAGRQAMGRAAKSGSRTSSGGHAWAYMRRDPDYRAAWAGQAGPPRFDAGAFPPGHPGRGEVGPPRRDRRAQGRPDGAVGSRRRGALEGQAPHPEGDCPHEGGLQGVPRTGRRAPPEGPETGTPCGKPPSSGHRPWRRREPLSRAGPAASVRIRMPPPVRHLRSSRRGSRWTPDVRLRWPALAESKRTAETAFTGY